MQRALELARFAEIQGEVPVGAVLTYNNEIIGEGYNQVISNNDPSAHAEILAIRQAAQKQQNYRLVDSTLYTTLEPCCMCAGALVHARVKRLVYAARDVQSGAAGSRYNLVNSTSLNHKIVIDEGIMQQQCSLLLSDFFNARRKSHHHVR